MIDFYAIDKEAEQRITDWLFNDKLLKDVFAEINISIEQVVIVTLMAYWADRLKMEPRYLRDLKKLLKENYANNQDLNN